MGHRWRVVGARLLHVVGQWSDSTSMTRSGYCTFGRAASPFMGPSWGALSVAPYTSLFATRPGSWLCGAGILGSWVSRRRRPLPGVGRLADIAAPAMLISQAIGRVGDIINGEHFADPSSLPWAVVYTQPRESGTRSATHAPGSCLRAADGPGHSRPPLAIEETPTAGRHVLRPLFSFLLRGAVLPQLLARRVQRVRGFERSADYRPGSNSDHDSAVDIQGPALQARAQASSPPPQGSLAAQPKLALRKM